MKSIELLALLIKISAVFLFLGLLVSLRGIYPYFLEPYSEDPQFLLIGIISALTTVVGFVLAIIFWNFPISVSKWFLPKSSDNNYSDIDLKVENLEVILYSAIGVYLVCSNIPNLAYDIMYYAFLSETELNMFSNNRSVGESIIEIMYSLGSVIIGLLLALFSGNLKSAIGKFRQRT